MNRIRVSFEFDGSKLIISGFRRLNPRCVEYDNTNLYSVMHSSSVLHHIYQMLSISDSSYPVIRLPAYPSLKEPPSKPQRSVEWGEILYVRPSLRPLWLAVQPLWLALRPLWLALRPLQLALRSLQLDLRPLQLSLNP